MSRKNRKSRCQKHIENIDKMIQAIKDGTAPRSMLSGKTIMELNEERAFCLRQQLLPEVELAGLDLKIAGAVRGAAERLILTSAKYYIS